MRDKFSLDGKRALVIGASNAIGRAIAVALAEAGADVAVATTTPSKDEETIANSCANEIWALDRKGFAQAIDAADAADVGAPFERTVGELGGTEGGGRPRRKDTARTAWASPSRLGMSSSRAAVETKLNELSVGDLPKAPNMGR